MRKKKESLDLERHFLHLDNIKSVVDPYKPTAVQYDLHVGRTLIGCNMSHAMVETFKNSFPDEKLIVTRLSSTNDEVNYKFFHIPVTREASIFLARTEISENRNSNRACSREILRLFGFLHLCHQARYVPDRKFSKIPGQQTDFAKVSQCFALANIPKKLWFSQGLTKMTFRYTPNDNLTARETLVAQQRIHRFIDGV